jgi:hypothetical protein
MIRRNPFEAASKAAAVHRGAVGPQRASVVIAGLLRMG